MSIYIKGLELPKNPDGTFWMHPQNRNIRQQTYTITLIVYADGTITAMPWESTYMPFESEYPAKEVSEECHDGY